MGRSLALAAALLGAMPCAAGELDGLAPGTWQFFVRIPLGASGRDREPVYGFAVRGYRDYEAIAIDSRAMRAAETALGAGFDGKILLVGGVAVGAALLASGAGSSASQNPTPQQTQQQRMTSCPKTPPTC